MSLSPEQAAEALREIEATRQRSHELGVYCQGGPILLIWGVIWIVGYGLTAVSPGYTTIVWLALTVVGAVAGWLISSSGCNPGQSFRYVTSWVVFLLLLGGSWAILTPQTASQRAALTALLVAAGYAFAGIWWWQRYLRLGLALIAVTIFGFFFAPWFELWSRTSTRAGQGKAREYQQAR